MWSWTYKVAPRKLAQDSFGKIQKQSGLKLLTCQAAKGLGRCVGRGKESVWVTDRGENNGWVERRQLAKTQMEISPEMSRKQSFMVVWQVENYKGEQTCPENHGHCTCLNSTNQLPVVTETVALKHGLSPVAYREQSGSHWSLGEQKAMVNELITQTVHRNMKTSPADLKWTNPLPTVQPEQLLCQWLAGSAYVPYKGLFRKWSHCKVTVGRRDERAWLRTEEVNSALGIHNDPRRHKVQRKSR